MHALVVGEMLAFMLVDVEVVVQTSLLNLVKSAIVIEFFISLLEALHVLLRILKQPLLLPVRLARQDLMELRRLLVVPNNLWLHHMVHNVLDRRSYTVL